MKSAALHLSPIPAADVLYPQGSIVLCMRCGVPLYKLQRSIYVGEPVAKSAWKYAPVTPSDLLDVIGRSDIEPGTRAAVKAMGQREMATHCDGIPQMKPGDFMDCAVCKESFSVGQIHNEPDGPAKFGDKGYTVTLAIIPPQGQSRRVN